MDDSSSSWTAVGKVVFRFFFVYFLLYVFPFPLGFIPYIGVVFDHYQTLWLNVIPWVGKHILHLSYDINVFPNGSGDTTFNYVQVFTFAAMSVAACIVWSIIDWRRKNYDQASYWLSIGIRFYLGVYMLSYGFSKIFMMQFQLIESRMSQTYGDSTPMGLLWTFMGHSPGYNLFIGLGEVLGGLLLFFRKTATLGSLLVVAIMANVVVLNFTYDVPVKLFSLHLLFLAMIVALSDGRRLFNFLMDRPVEPRREKLYFMEGRTRKIRVVGNALVVLWLVWMSIGWRFEYKKQFSARKPALQGNYVVKDFYLNGSNAVVPGDTVTWKSLRIEYEGFARAVLPSDHAVDFTLRVDTVAKTFNLHTTYDQYLLTYRKKGNNLELWGPRLQKDSVRILLERQQQKEWTLLTSKFRWINEYPDNR